MKQVIWSNDSYFDDKVRESITKTASVSIWKMTATR